VRPGALPILPAPLHAVVRGGPPVALGPGARVVAPGETEPVGHLVAHQLSALLGTEVGVAADDDGRPGAVVLRLLPGGAGAATSGAYRVQVDGGRVLVAAVDLDGLRHGATTLRRLVRTDGTGTGTLQPVLVVDGPRFSWRGLHLDVARHFHDVPTIERVLDVMADLKMNVLHLHLTDDQGWRLEIPSRPLLTEVSGRTAVDGGPGGFYTVADYAHLQRYAAARGVTLVPEIGMPGHVNAAQHAYGELTPTGEPADAYTGVEVGFSRLHPELPATKAFVRDVVRDVAAMTHGPYLHIGGEEALTLTRAEYSGLVAMIAEQVRVHGKTVVGWQEITQTPLAPGTVVQYWDERADTSAVVDAACQGARIVLSPASRVFLDLKYDSGPAPVGATWGRNVDLREAYDWEPLALLPALLPGSVTGVEAAVWTETVRTEEDLFRVLLPRLAAVAEVAWSVPLRRRWPDFAERVAHLAHQWDAAGLPWYRSPQVAW